MPILGSKTTISPPSAATPSSNFPMPNGRNGESCGTKSKRCGNERRHRNKGGGLSRFPTPPRALPYAKERAGLLHIDCFHHALDLGSVSEKCIHARRLLIGSVQYAVVTDA